MKTTGIARRDVAERRRDTLGRLAEERDIWVSTGHPDHGPHQVPLWFRWDGQAVWMCTGETSATARNVRIEPRVRLALPDTFDVVLLQERQSASRTGQFRRTPQTRSPESSDGTHVRRKGLFCTYAWRQRRCWPGVVSRSCAAESSCARERGWSSDHPAGRDPLARRAPNVRPPGGTRSAGTDQTVSLLSLTGARPGDCQAPRWR